MRLYTTKEFARLARRNGLDDNDLLDAIDRAERGLVDGDLGGLLIKQRVARAGEGKSGGFRTVVCYRRGTRAVFLHVFEKSRKANLSKVELETYQDLADKFDKLSNQQLDKLVEERGWRRIDRKKDEQEELSE